MSGMTPNRAIYLINLSPNLLKAWREMSEPQKRELLLACQTAEDNDIDKIMKEVIEGQRRLF
jgi:hypothetical protein